MDPLYENNIGHYNASLKKMEHCCVDIIDSARTSRRICDTRSIFVSTGIDTWVEPKYMSNIGHYLECYLEKVEHCSDQCRLGIYDIRPPIFLLALIPGVMSNIGCYLQYDIKKVSHPMLCGYMGSLRICT